MWWLEVSLSLSLCAWVHVCLFACWSRIAIYQEKEREKGHQPRGLAPFWEKQHLSQQNREEKSITIQLRCVCVCVQYSWLTLHQYCCIFVLIDFSKCVLSGLYYLFFPNLEPENINHGHVILVTHWNHWNTIWGIIVTPLPWRSCVLDNHHHHFAWLWSHGVIYRYIWWYICASYSIWSLHLIFNLSFL